jgi:glycerol-3-phosphate acyltransferase PlsY
VADVVKVVNDVANAAHQPLENWSNAAHRSGGRMSAMAALAVLALAFIAGSVPFSNIAARLVRGVDLRTVGSGTVSGTSLFRVAGFPALAVAGIFDVAKGALGPALAGNDRAALAAVAGGLAVAGHNWSPFLRGAGGRGVAPALGALLVQAWPGAVLLLGGLVVGKMLRNTGLGGFVAEALLAPVLAVLEGAAGAVAGAAIAVPMLLKRLLGNGRPERPGVQPYVERLLYDREHQ